MKNIFYSVVMMLTILVGCTPTPPTPTNSNPYGIYLDSSVFIKLTFQGRTISNYEVRSTLPNIDKILKDYSLIGTFITISGAPNFTQFSFGTIASNLNAKLKDFNYIDYKAQIEIGRTLIKEDGPLGVYYFDGGGFFDYSLPVYKFYSLNRDLDPNTFSKLTVTSIDQNFVSGTLNLYIIDNGNIIPAIGSFRVHKVN